MRTRRKKKLVKVAQHRGGAGTVIAAELTTRAQEPCALRAIEHAAVYSASLKKLVTRSGCCTTPERSSVRQGRDG